MKFVFYHNASVPYNSRNQNKKKNYFYFPRISARFFLIASDVLTSIQIQNELSTILKLSENSHG